MAHPVTREWADSVGDLGWASLAEAFSPGSALVAVVAGPEHEIVYTNDSYAEAFGSSSQLVEAGIRSLVEDVYGSGKPASADAAGFTVVCTPLHDDQRQLAGVLVLAVLGAASVAGHERQTALTLQRSLLPHVLHRPDELDVAVRYQPGLDESVGGDWYDVVPLGAGRTAIVMGDVRGRGVHAAAVMGQLRTAVRAYARLDLPPGEILELLDGLVADMDGAGAVSCCYAVYDPIDAVFTFASAGHPAPVMICPDGTVEPVALTRSGPLGAHGAAFPEHDCALPDGATLVLYTDGLTSWPGSPHQQGLDRLSAALRRASGSVESRCEGVLAEMVPVGAHDDVALMLVARRPVPAFAGARARTIELTLSEGRDPTRRARAFCHGALSMWQVPDQTHEDIILVVSELVTNAILHGEAARALRVRRTPLRVVIEVFDNGRRMPHPRVADLDSESGRGLHLVARLADRWGARPVRGGKVVWCEFDIPADGNRSQH